MKIEQLVVQHFFNAKQVTLQGMGTFRLSPDFIMPMEKDKDSQIPENSISFQYNSRATEDDALINFIVQQTRKMKALASADLDSYLVLGKQFLNIGKPFKIEGLGLLVLNQQGEYEFTQGHSFNSKNEEPTAALKEKMDDDEISFTSENKKIPVGNKKGLLIAAIIIGVGMIGAAAWYFLVNNKNNKAEQATETPAVKPDSSAMAKAGSDTLTNKIDTTVTAPIVPATNNEGYTFKVVIKNYSSLQLAQQAYNRLTGYGHKLLLYTHDSVIFKVALPINRPLSDTALARDSVRQFLFGGNPYIELK